MVQTPINMDIENDPGRTEYQGKPPTVAPLSSLASDSLYCVFVLQGLPSLTRRAIRLARYPSQTPNLQTSLHRWPKVTVILKFRFL
jgi:hypothetical protein